MQSFLVSSFWVGWIYDDDVFPSELLLFFLRVCFLVGGWLVTGQYCNQLRVVVAKSFSSDFMHHQSNMTTCTPSQECIIILNKRYVSDILLFLVVLAFHDTVVYIIS